MNREVIAGIASGLAMAAMMLGAAFARRLGLIDGEAVTRVIPGVVGLWMAWYGNRMPKIALPLPHDCARRARRFAAWSMVLSGLFYAGMWAFAPIPVATVGGIMVIFAGFAATLGYCLSLKDRLRTR